MLGAPPSLYGAFIVIADQSNNGCVVSTFDEGVGSMGGDAVVGVRCVQDWTEDIALGNTGVEDDGSAGAKVSV